MSPQRPPWWPPQLPCSLLHLSGVPLPARAEVEQVRNRTRRFLGYRPDAFHWATLSLVRAPPPAMATNKVACPRAGAVQRGVWSVDYSLSGPRWCSGPFTLKALGAPRIQGVVGDALRAPAQSLRHQRMSVEEAGVELVQQRQDLLRRRGLCTRADWQGLACPHPLPTLCLSTGPRV